MASERKILKQIMYLLEDLIGPNKEKPSIKDIELIHDDRGIVIGYRVKIVAPPTPGLKLVKDD